MQVTGTDNAIRSNLNGAKPNELAVAVNCDNGTLPGETNGSAI